MLLTLTRVLLAIIVCLFEPIISRADEMSVCEAFSSVNLADALAPGLTIKTSPEAIAVVDACEKDVKAEKDTTQILRQYARTLILTGGFQEAGRQLEKLAARNDSLGLRLLGFLSESLPQQSGVNENFERLYERAVDAGDTPALLLLASVRIGKLRPGESLTPDIVSLIERAVKAEFPPAMVWAASYSENGWMPGITPGRAFELARSAAEAGDRRGMLLEAEYLDRGYGTAVDTVAADKLKQKSSALGVSSASTMWALQ